MNYEKINGSIDISKMQRSHVTIVGGGYGLGSDLARCGVGSLTFIDFDHVDESNPTRQDLDAADIGQLKVQATQKHIYRVNPDTQVDWLARDVCTLSPDYLKSKIGHTDLLVLAVDDFPPDALGNLLSQRWNIPAVFISLYAGGRAGEIIFSIPGETACYRCVAKQRYEAFYKRSLQAGTPSTGGIISDIHLVDAIAHQICAGLLTRGSDTRLGRLIDQLGNRNLLQIKIDPDYTLGGKDIFAQHLGTGSANFSFNTIALEEEIDPDCPDCKATHRSPLLPKKTSVK